MKEIPLRNGGTAFVDDEDEAFVRQFNWIQTTPDAVTYAVTSQKIGGKWRLIKLHRLLLGLKIGDGVIVDHIDGNGLNNQRGNLRICSHQQNLRNQDRTEKPYKTSKFKGVCWHKKNKKWIAGIFINKKKIYLGQFESEEDAAAAYNAAARKFFGEFARLNSVA